MNTSDMILQMCAHEKVSIAELARRIGQTRQNLFKKLKRGTLTDDEVQQIMNAVGASYVQVITLKDGTRIEYGNTAGSH